MTRRGKTVVAAVLVLVAGVVGFLMWGRSSSSVFDQRSGSANYSVHLTIDSPRVGDNTVQLDVSDLSGTPVKADEVTVEPVMVDMGHALTPTTALPAQQGNYRAEHTDLPMAGRWELTIAIRRAHTTERVTFALVL
ncbi:FixH family protein [Actinokineospora inagensis]|uniref:FixH family protein n=1 Tax=Actinokineospora inagensis TaxID=103730 RepID=UPI0003FA3F43|nr:FixH family protein [Actinokineospora inagensis]